MKLKLMATDLDDTLIGDDGQISEKNILAMQKALGAGLFVVPTTGRCFFEIPKKFRSIKPYTHCISSNGAIVADRDGNIIHKRVFKTELALRIFDILNEYDTMIELYADGTPTTDETLLNQKAYNYFSIEEKYHMVMDTTRKGVKDIRKHIENCGGVEIFNVFFHNPEERKTAFQRIGEIKEVETTTSMQSNMEILQKGVNKGAALKELFSALHLSKEETLVMGDSNNDLSMFLVAGTALAVQNACDNLKAHATAVICSNNESAFDYAVSHYLKEV